MVEQMAIESAMRLLAMVEGRLLQRELRDRNERRRRRGEDSCCFFYRLTIVSLLVYCFWQKFVIPDVARPLREISKSLDEGNQQLEVIKSNSWYG